MFLPISNDCTNNVKLRSKKLFAFPKKSKQIHSASVKGPPFNVAQTLTPIGIAQIKQMITFLVRNESKLLVEII